MGVALLVVWDDATRLLFENDIGSIEAGAFNELTALIDL